MQILVVMAMSVMEHILLRLIFDTVNHRYYKLALRDALQTCINKNQTFYDLNATRAVHQV